MGCFFSFFIAQFFNGFLKIQTTQSLCYPINKENSELKDNPFGQSQKIKPDGVKIF